MTPTIRIQLSVMMFIQFFIWGAWAVTMGTYLGAIGFSGTQIGQAYSTAAIAAIVSPFFIGMVADRYLPAQITMGILHLLGGVFMFLATTVDSFAPFFVLLLAYTLCYMPTLALVNAVSFNQMENPSQEFPGVRVLGTLGWIIAGLLIGFAEQITGFLGLSWEMTNIEGTNLPLRMAAIGSFVLGFYCFTLPNTPPQAKGEKTTIREIIGLDTLSLMKDRSFAIFIVSSLLICIPLAFYYNFTNPFLNEIGVENAAAKMTMGQMSEFGFMLVMPFFLRALGIKYMLLTGMLFWAARYVLFAFGDADSALVYMLYFGIIFHGICYDFFFVTGQLYVDRVAPKAIRASAQGFIALITYGVGMYIGAWISGIVVDMYAIEGTEPTMHNWTSIWLIPAAMAAVVMVIFFILFQDKVSPEPETVEDVEVNEENDAV